MNTLHKLLLPLLALLVATGYAQNSNTIVATLDDAAKVIAVKQEITFTNTGGLPLDTIVLNDWVNAYSGRNAPLAKRFSDEYNWTFHRAREEERGSTTLNSATAAGTPLRWQRPEGRPDLLSLKLTTSLMPGRSITLNLDYQVKLPSSRFTRFGYNDKGGYYLKDWYLTPARIENGMFVNYSNENLDDIANAVTDYSVTFIIPSTIALVTDLDVEQKQEAGNTLHYKLTGQGRNGFILSLEKAPQSYEIFKNSVAEISYNLDKSRTTDIQRVVLIDKITNFVNDNLGRYPFKKIVIAQEEYDRNPVYGLNQLPAFLAPFPDSFLFELRFLKTYLNTYLKNTLRLDPRKDTWIYDGIQTCLAMQYIKEHHPEKKMTGAIGNWGILKGFHLFDVKLNDQYLYFYLLMARKNLDQPIGDPKNTLIKFNEQIAGRYKSGLALNYLNEYLGDKSVPEAIAGFYAHNLSSFTTSRNDFKNSVMARTNKDLSWFFDGLVATRKIIDYRFERVRADKDSLTVTIKNNNGLAVPIPLYSVKDKKIQFRQWLENIKTDSTFTIARQDADRLVLNSENIVPEYNQRNNWHRLDKFFPNNRPLKLTFFQDLENPAYNQLFYVPSFSFNLYDGFSPGLRLHNKTLFLERPFLFDVEPTYSTKTGTLIGSAYMMYNQYLRDSNIYNIRYGISGSTFHYAPDARYYKFTPSVQLRIRQEDLRRNFKQYIQLRQVMVNRAPSAYVVTDQRNENYSVFNARFSQVESEAARHYSFYTDTQFANSFGKLSGEIQFRRLFDNNRQINLRLFAGTFLYRNTNSDFFSFGLDRVSDYLFDYALYGRSETTGLLSRQFVLADGGFKSQFKNHFANEWMTTLNAGFNIWNWVEVYGDAGAFSNTATGVHFVYDSGVRLNLVPDYFELYFPVYSSNGWEFDNTYAEKVRFVVTIHPSTLIGLFTRRWF